MWWDDSPENSNIADNFYIRSQQNYPINTSTIKTTILNAGILDLMENNRVELALPQETRTSENDVVFSQSKISQNMSQTDVLHSCTESNKCKKRKLDKGNTDLIESNEPKKRKKKKKSDNHKTDDKLLDKKSFVEAEYKKEENHSTFETSMKLMEGESASEKQHKKKKTKSHSIYETNEKLIKEKSATEKQQKKKKQKSVGASLEVPLSDTNDPKTEVTNELFSQFRHALPVIEQLSSDNVSHSECPSTFSVNTEQLGQMRTHVNSFIGHCSEMYSQTVDNECDDSMNCSQLLQDKDLKKNRDNKESLKEQLDCNLFMSPQNCIIKKKKKKSVPCKLSLNETKTVQNTLNESKNNINALTIMEPMGKPFKKKKKSKRKIEIAEQKSENFNMDVDEFMHNLIESIHSKDLQKSTKYAGQIEEQLLIFGEKEKRKKQKLDIQFKSVISTAVVSSKKKKKAKKSKEMSANEISGKIKESKSRKDHKTKKCKSKDMSTNLKESSVRRKKKIKSKAIINTTESDSDDCNKRKLNQDLHSTVSLDPNISKPSLVLKDTSNFRTSISKDKSSQRVKKADKLLAPVKKDNYKSKIKSKALIDTSDSEDEKQQVHIMKQEADKVKHDSPIKKKKKKHSTHKAQSSIRKGKKNKFTGIDYSVTKSSSQKTNESDIILKESVDFLKFRSDTDKEQECQTPLKTNEMKNIDTNPKKSNEQWDSVNITKSNVTINSNDSDACSRNEYKLKEKSMGNTEKSKLIEIESEQVKKETKDYINTNDPTNLIINSMKTNSDNATLNNFLDGIMSKMLETMKAEEDVDLSATSNAPSIEYISGKSSRNTKAKVKVEKIHVKQEEEDEDMKFSSEYSDIDRKLLEYLFVQIDFEVPKLHTLETNVTRSPFHEIQQKINELGVEIKNGNYSPEEIEIIANNWDKFCKHHCFPSRPELFINPRKFGSERSILPMKEFLKFVRYLANGLPNRLLNSVYNKFKRMYSTANHGRFTEEEDDIIMSTINSANCTKIFVRLGIELNRDPNAIEKHYIFLREGGKHDFKEDSINPQDANRIVQKLYKEMNCQSIFDLKNKLFPFNTFVKIGEELQIRPLRIQTWWTYNIHPKLFVSGTRNLTNVKLELIDLILKNPAYKTVDHVNYNDLLPYFDGWTAPALGKLIRNIIRSKDDPDRGKHDFRAVLSKAKDHFARAPPKYLATATFEDGELNVDDFKA